MRGGSIFLAIVYLLILTQGCTSTKTRTSSAGATAWDVKSQVEIKDKVPSRKIEVRDVDPTELTAFAETLVGIPYRYGSMKKENGFDCSGFINYVFNHYKIAVPRTSAAFTNAGQEVSIKDSKRGDLILFTGSDVKSGVVGHMGIVTENTRHNFSFIHASTSSGVIFSTLNSYFAPRFVKVIRLFHN